MSDRAIARAIEVSDKTVGKAIAGTSARRILPVWGPRMTRNAPSSRCGSD